MATEDNLPDWLRQLRDQQMGTAGAQPAEPAEPPGLPEPAQSPDPAPPAEPSAQEPQAPSGGDMFEELRQKASVAPPPVEERSKLQVPIVSRLKPFQRFVLALMLFLNVSVLGCLFLMVAGKISFVR